MELQTLYKVVSGTATEIEHILNVLGKDGWRPVAMASQQKVLTVILENKIMEEAKLNLSSIISEDTLEEEIQ
jgi:hypothetical protein